VSGYTPPVPVESDQCHGCGLPLSPTYAGGSLEEIGPVCLGCRSVLEPLSLAERRDLELVDRLLGEYWVTK